MPQVAQNTRSCCACRRVKSCGVNCSRRRAVAEGVARVALLTLSLSASRADAAESVGMANQATAGPTVALGVLSSAGSAGTATTSDYVYRRTTVREGLRGFDPSVLQRVAVRFLLAGTEVTKPHRNNVKELRMAREENRTHGDMIFLDMCDLCHRWRCRRPKCLPSLLYISGHSTC